MNPIAVRPAEPRSEAGGAGGARSTSGRPRDEGRFDMALALAAGGPANPASTPPRAQPKGSGETRGMPANGDSGPAGKALPLSPPTPPAPAEEAAGEGTGTTRAPAAARIFEAARGVTDRAARMVLESASWSQGRLDPPVAAAVAAAIATDESGGASAVLTSPVPAGAGAGATTGEGTGGQSLPVVASSPAPQARGTQRGGAGTDSGAERERDGSGTAKDARRPSRAAGETFQLAAGDGAAAVMAVVRGDSAVSVRDVAAARVAARLVEPGPDAAAAARAGGGLTLQLEGENGIEGHLRVTVRGSAIHATIQAADPAIAARLEREVGDLRQALLERGFPEVYVTVRHDGAIASAGADASWRDARARREGGEGEGAPGRPRREPEFTEDRPRRNPSRSQRER